jgi:hypothetical protein
MNGHADPHDDALLDELRALGRTADPLPERVVFAAQESLSWRTIDAELAELTYDSVLDDDRLALVRGHQAGRLLTFSTPALTIEVQVTNNGSDRRLVGQLVPAQAAVLVLRHAGGTSEVEVDADGRFRTEPVPAGPLALSCRLGDGPDDPTVQTEWVTL